MNKKELGDIGEKIATNYLKQYKYKILERNFRSKQGEIDIIAKDKDELVFIEVKTRKSLKYGLPIEAVNYQKQKHIYKTAEYYIYIKNINNIPIRFDVIEILIEKNQTKIRHTKQTIEK